MGRLSLVTEIFHVLFTEAVLGTSLPETSVDISLASVPVKIHLPTKLKPKACEGDN